LNGASRHGALSRVGLGAALARAKLIAHHAPYSWRLLKAVPYGVARRFARGKCHDYPLMEPLFRDRCGLEIGGPSPIFGDNKLIPVYNCCAKMDNVNFSYRTIWDRASSRPHDRMTFTTQYVAEASHLDSIPDEAYDFVLASHVLEHVANPLGALAEWKRVLRRRGAMLVIVPDLRVSFDRNRNPTSFEHIEADWANGTSEADLGHIQEILTCHDLGLDPGAGSALQFRERCLRNFTIRALHHHVFVPEVVLRMLDVIGMKVLSLAIERPAHIVALAVRTDAHEAEDAQRQNLGFLEEQAEWRKRDPLARRRGSAVRLLSPEFAWQTFAW